MVDGRIIAQTLAVEYPERVDKLILLSTDSGGTDADLASPAVWSRLIDTSGTPHEQAHRLLFLLFPNEVAETFYHKFGDIVAAARAHLSPDLLRRQAAAMDAWHSSGVANLIATDTRAGANRYREDIVIPSSNALKLVNAIPGAWLAQFPRSGHAFIAQHPQAAAELINSFLALHDAH